MQFKRCVCGKSISSARNLCAKCLGLYGREPANWPEWVRYSAYDIQREWNRNRRHDELMVIDDTQVDDRWPHERGVGAAWDYILEEMV